MKVIAIGFGNTLRGDDGAGCELATILERSEPGVIVLVRHALLPELATTLAGADGVLFLDRVHDSHSLTTWEQFERFHRDDFVRRITAFVERVGS